MFISTSKVFLASVLIGMTLFISGCDGKKAAKEEIEQKGITYNIDSFADAIASKNTDVINLFIKAGIDASNPKVLGAIIESNDPMLLEKLLDEDLNPNIKITTDGSNAPLLNKLVSSPEMLKVLLEADELYINAQDNEGNTALMQAMIDNQPASVTLLVTAGADVNMRNKEGFDAHTLIFGEPLSSYEDFKSEDITLTLLKALGGKLNPNATFDSLLKMKRDKISGLTLLHITTIRLMKDAGSFLIEKKANVNAKATANGKYISVFDTANSPKYPEGLSELEQMVKSEQVINMLLDNGANIKGSELDLKSSEVQHIGRLLEKGASEKILMRLGASKEKIRIAKEQNEYAMTAPAMTEEVAPAAEATAY